MPKALPIPHPAHLTREGLRTIDEALVGLGWAATRTYEQFRFFALGDLRTRLEGPPGKVQSAQFGVWAAEAGDEDVDEDIDRRIVQGREAYAPIRAMLVDALGASSGDWGGPAGARRDDAADFVLESDVWNREGLQIASFLEHFDDVNPVTIAIEIYSC